MRHHVVDGVPRLAPAPHAPHGRGARPWPQEQPPRQAESLLIQLGHSAQQTSYGAKKKSSVFAAFLLRAWLLSRVVT
ncbi:hypothetical protein FRAHR75_290073 [Frankia sp. Hr75.2]|nr:hypothetical protein FRAHR75_290073 [Frankia sp. Hr75.2]